MINQISAGEVVERPASVIKELMENALDAGANQVSVEWRQGGQSLIRVQDNGGGMDKEDLLLSIRRHTTSKLPDDDLRAISSFGFRGEALAAIVSMARVTLSSTLAGQSHGWALEVEAGKVLDFRPIPPIHGTLVEVRDLFFATPARLKFMSSPLVEQTHILSLMEKLLLAHSGLDLTIQHESKQKKYPSNPDERLSSCLGNDFIPNSFPLWGERDGYSLTGFAGLPTYHRASPDHQFFFVNGRSVKDKVLASCLKGSFANSMPQGRHPVVVLFLTVPLLDVDVNVHPAKTEVRFRDSRFVRGFVLGAFRQALFTHSNRVASLSVAKNPLAWMPEENLTTRDGLDNHQNAVNSSMERMSRQRARPFPTLGPQNLFFSPSSREEILQETEIDPLPLGQAIGQIHGAYIVACNGQGLVVVDPHAAHERIVYEKMKTEWAQSIGHVQPFLLSVCFSVTAVEATLLQERKGLLAELGFQVEMEDCTCRIFSLPALFRSYEPQALLQDLLGFMKEEEDPKNIVLGWRNHILAHWACRQSLKLGQKFSLIEMNALLREIETTPHGAQCNHGRPVYRIFSMKELGKWFER